MWSIDLTNLRMSTVLYEASFTRDSYSMTTVTRRTYTSQDDRLSEPQILEIAESARSALAAFLRRQSGIISSPTLPSIPQTYNC